MNSVFSILRELDHQNFTSGALLAERLGISRASVSNLLADVEEYGITLLRRHGVGYRLTQPIDWLDAALIQSYLPANTAIRISTTEVLGSTNRQLLQSPSHGAALATEWQDAGRGRLGRRWQSVLGGSLLFSLCWQFEGGPARLAGLPLATGVAMAETLRTLGFADVALKWPNDLLLRAADGSWGKLGGILIEMQGDALGPSQVVIGIGLNLCRPQQQTPDYPVAALEDNGHLPERNLLLGRLLAALEDMLDDFSSHGFAPLRPRWEALNAWHGENVRIIAVNGNETPGQLIGLNDDGALRLQTAQGEQLIHAGDISLRRT